LARRGYAQFAAVQQSFASASAPDLAVLLRISQGYRRAMRDCMEYFRAEGESMGEEVGSILEDCEEIAQFHTFWHLCEVFGIHAQQTDVRGLLVDPFLEWLNTSEPLLEFDEFLADMHHWIKERGPCESHPDYWYHLRRLVSRGCVEEARELLSQHSEYPTDKDLFTLDFKGQRKETMPVWIACLMLETMPRASTSASIFSFQSNWKQWHADCQAQLKLPQVQQNGKIYHFLKALSGDTGELFEGHQPKWYEQVAAEVFLKKPWMTDTEVKNMAEERFCDQCEQSDQVSKYDDLLCLVMLQAFSSVITEFATIFPSPWLPAHITDLLYFARVIDVPSGEDTGDFVPALREHFLSEFALSLAGHGRSGSFWWMAVKYLEQCPKNGPALMSLLLEREPVTDYSKAIAILATCESLRAGNNSASSRRACLSEPDYERLTSSVRRVLARGGANGRGSTAPGSALLQILLSGDRRYLREMVEKTLIAYTVEENIGNEQDIESVVEGLGSQTTCPAEAVPLVKYRNYVVARRRGNVKETIAALLSLLDSGRPKAYWLPLLCRDTDRLLDQYHAELSDRDLAELMHKTRQLMARVEREISAPSFSSARADSVFSVLLALPSKRVAEEKPEDRLHGEVTQAVEKLREIQRRLLEARRARAWGPKE